MQGIFCLLPREIKILNPRCLRGLPDGRQASG